MEQESFSPEKSAPPDAGATSESFGSVADEFSAAFSGQPERLPQSIELPATMTQLEQPEQQSSQADSGDDLPDFTLEDQPATIEKLYAADELASLAESNPQAAWEYAIRANDYLQQNLQTINEIQQAADKVGSVEALQTLGDLGAALFTPGEASPGTVYQSLLKLQDAYPDPENGPMNQVVRAVASYRAPEVIAEIGDQLTAFLDGTHPYFDLAVYQPENETVRYQAEQYIGHLNAQRTALLEALAPAVYAHFGNDFTLREQYGLVGPEGEFYGLADNTIDKAVRDDLPENLRPVYDALPPSLRGRLNNATLEEISDNLTQRKAVAEYEAKLAAIEKAQSDQSRQVNERIEAQQREQADARASAWETGVEQYVARRLAETYKLGQYPAQVIQMQLKQFMQSDPVAKQVYDRAKEAAKAGNTPLLARIEGDLSRHAEKAIRQYLADWQKATGQVVRRPGAPQPQRKPQAVPLYSRPPGDQLGNGQDGDGITVADAFQQAFKNLSPYVGN